jgi:amidophosphoribosyltransferase
MCGIIGIYLYDKNSNAYSYILNGLNVLQHRGQDSAGIITCSNNIFYSHKNNGKVNDVFTKDIGCSKRLIGNIGLGHVRYSTTGSLNVEQCQPLYTNYPYGIALVHNGNITNTNELKEIMKSEKRHINTSSDSELLLNIFATKLNKITENDNDTIIEEDVFFNIVSEIYAIVKGSYSVIIMINGFGLLAFKDPYGIRPLCFGKNEENYILSSESVALEFLNYKLDRELNAGECIFISNNGKMYCKQIIKNPLVTPCLFEYIYFARPESVINGILVYQARKTMGELLALKMRNQYDFITKIIDVVMPIPESSRISALRLAYVLKKPYCEGFIKSSYVGRTFIMPNQQLRKSSIKMKLNTINQEFANKNVLIVDDSIVRGNTSIELIKMARNAGAKNIYFASIAPPVIYPNYYGISIPTSEELVAHNRSIDEITEFIGADYVIYNDLKDIVKHCASLNPKKIQMFETSCFDGNYICYTRAESKRPFVSNN